MCTHLHYLIGMIGAHVTHILALVYIGARHRRADFTMFKDIVQIESLETLAMQTGMEIATCDKEVKIVDYLIEL